LTDNIKDDNKAKKLFAINDAWKDNEIKAFGKSTTCDVELNKIENFEAIGAKIPIYSFYLNSSQFESKMG